MKKNNLILFLSFLLFSFSLHAGNYTIYKMTDLDVSMLPPFCQVWHKGDTAATDAWVEKLQINNIHHVCKGLNHVNWATISLNAQVIHYNVKSGIDEFKYVVDGSKGKSFPLKAFLLVNMAKLYAISSKFEEAVSVYKAALEENPQFARAYADLFDLYLKLKDQESAKQILTEGLTHIPNSKLLLKRKKKLKN